MDLKSILELNKLKIQSWTSTISDGKITKEDKELLYKIAEYYPELNTKLKSDAGCSTCLKNCMRMVLTKLKGETISPIREDISMLDKQNISFHINPAYKMNQIGLNIDGKLIQIIDISSYIGDNITTFYIKDATELIRKHLLQNKNLLKYFEIEEECDGVALTFEEKEDSHEKDILLEKDILRDQEISEIPETKVVNTKFKPTKHKK